MSVSVKAGGVTRQAIFEEYQRSPESAPLKMPSLVYTTTAEDYRFEKVMARTQGSTAAELIDAAEKDAQLVNKGRGFALTRGIVTLCVGMAFLGGAAAFPLLVFVGLPCIYFGVTWTRQGNDKIRQANYDKRFAADVARYAARLSGEEANTTL